jgi:hypothetical protein
MSLGRGDVNKGDGEVQHVAVNRQFEFKLERVTKPYLSQYQLDRFDLKSLKDDDVRNQFAVALANARRTAATRPRI